MGFTTKLSNQKRFESKRFNPKRFEQGRLLLKPQPFVHTFPDAAWRDQAGLSLFTVDNGYSEVISSGLAIGLLGGTIGEYFIIASNVVANSFLSKNVDNQLLFSNAYGTANHSKFVGAFEEGDENGYAIITIQNAGGRVVYVAELPSFNLLTGPINPAFDVKGVWLKTSYDKAGIRIQAFLSDTDVGNWSSVLDTVVAKSFDKLKPLTGAGMDSGSPAPNGSDISTLKKLTWTTTGNL